MEDIREETAPIGEQENVDETLHSVIEKAKKPRNKKRDTLSSSAGNS